MEFPKDFTAREKALLGDRFEELYTYATAQPARGVTVNTLRCTPDWFAAHTDFAAEPSKFCRTAFTTAADFRPGRHPWHHAGLLYAQEPSASAPAALLDVRPGMRVADLCAAPGGKTSQLAAALQGQGLLLANEFVAARAEILRQNLERMGVTNAVITNEEKKIKTGRDYPKLNPRFALMDPTYTFSVPKKQMASGSFDILSHIMETYFSQSNEDNVSDDIMEALMRSVIRNLRVAMDSPEDYTARSNLMWDSTMAENRLIKMGKKCDFECHNMEHQLGAYTNCNHGCGLAVIHPVYYRHVYKEGLSKFVRFAENVWGIERDGKSDEALALAGIDALSSFIQEIGLPTTLKELGAQKGQLKEIADSCGISQGSYKPMTHEEILEIFHECYE